MMFKLLLKHVWVSQFHSMQCTPIFYFHQIMKDGHLVLFVCALVMIDVVILLMYSLVEGLMGNLKPKRIVNAEIPSEILGVSTMHAFRMVRCSFQVYEDK